MQQKLCEIDDEIKKLRQIITENLSLTKDQMEVLDRLENLAKRNEDIVKVLNYLVWRIESMDARSFHGGVMQNMFAGMLMGGGR